MNKTTRTHLDNIRSGEAARESEQNWNMVLAGTKTLLEDRSANV